MLKKFNRLNDIRSFLKAFSVINGVFIIEIVFLMYFFGSNVKDIISKFGDNGLIISVIIGAIILGIINILIFKKKVRLFLKKMQYLLLIEIIAYFIVYTIALIVINSELKWNIDKLDTFILGLILSLMIMIWARHISKNNIIPLIVLLLSIIYILLISSLSVVTVIHDSIKYNILYLISSLIVFSLLFSLVFLNKKININNYLIKGIHDQVIDIVLSFIFIVICLLLVAAIVVEFANNLYLAKLFDDWIPILSISVAMECDNLLYSKNIKIFMNKVYRYYFIFWIIIPPILFIFYLQRKSFGNYTTFKALLGIIAAIDAMVLLAFGDDMKTLLPKFKKKKTLISKTDSEYNIAELKLILGNITALTTFLTIIFPDETTVESWINKVATICYKIGIFRSKYLGDSNLDTIFSKNLLNDTQFKMIVFMFVIVGLLLVLSWVFFKVEKWLYIKISFK